MLKNSSWVIYSSIFGSTFCTFSGDYKEGYYIGVEVPADSPEANRPFYGPNQWPSEGIFPSKDTMYPITCSETGCFHEWQDLSLFNVPMFLSSPLLCWIFHLEGISSVFCSYINCNGVIILPYVFLSASFFYSHNI
jgi:hypothetical protein